MIFPAGSLSKLRHLPLFQKVNCDAPPPPLPPLDPNAAPPSPPPAETNAPPPEQSVLPASAIPNPGPYEGATMPAKRLTSLDTYDGFRMDISKPLSPFNVVIHSFWLGTSLPDGRTSTYSFVNQVANEDGLAMVRLDPSRKAVEGRIHMALLGGLAMGKAQVAMSPEGTQDQMLAEVDVGGMTWTGNLKYGSMGGGNVFGMNYYQGITERWAMGGEGMHIASNGSLLSSYTVKYECPAPAGEEEEGVAASPVGHASWFLGQLNPAHGTLNLCYKRDVTPNRVTLGAELECAPTLESTVKFGAEFQLTRSKVNLVVDGTGKVQSEVEAKLGKGQGAPTLKFSAEMDHGKDAMKFGYGLNVGS